MENILIESRGDTLSRYFDTVVYNGLKIDGLSIPLLMPIESQD